VSGRNVALALASESAPIPHDGAFEQELVAAARAVAVGELAAGVAHEISNPLFAILGLAELVMADTAAGSETHKRLSMVRESAVEIQQILHAFSELAGAGEDRFATTALEEAGRDAVALFRRTSASKKLQIVERYPAGRALVEGSTTRLRQVFLGLITNADQAMDGNGTVTLEVARGGAWFTGSVTDTGPGIDPEVAPYVFTPFFTTRAGTGGTGLGLAAARLIARQHGGDLSVESRPGHGARFTLRVPALEARS
jgi:signal transduction histidine kinase